MDFIGIYDNCLSSGECQEIIKYFEAHPNKKPGRVSKTLIRKDVKDSTEITMSLDDDNFVVKYIYRALFDGCNQYRIQYPSVTGIGRWAPSALFNLQRYLPRQGYFASHCENTNKHKHRVLVWMFYLNTVTDGGQTKFVSQDLYVNPVEGRLVIWPAHFTHYHHGVTSNTQTKYIATGWFQYC